MVDLHARIRRIALRGEDVVLTCKENVFPGLEPAANVVVLPCLACLSPEFWTLVLAENIPVTIAADLVLLRRLRHVPARWARSCTPTPWRRPRSGAARKVGFIDVIPEKENLVRDLANPEGVDRRSAFTNLVGDVGDIASGKRRLRNSDVLQQFYERQERARARARLNLGRRRRSSTTSCPRAAREDVMQPKRQLLLRGHRPRPGHRRARARGAVRDRLRALHERARLRRRRAPPARGSPTRNDGTLAFDARYCIGCGLCADACPHRRGRAREADAAAVLPPDDGGRTSVGEKPPDRLVRLAGPQGKEPPMTASRAARTPATCPSPAPPDHRARRAAARFRALRAAPAAGFRRGALRVRRSVPSPAARTGNPSRSPLRSRSSPRSPTGRIRPRRSSPAARAAVPALRRRPAASLSAVPGAALPRGIPRPAEERKAWPWVLAGCLLVFVLASAGA